MEVEVELYRPNAPVCVVRTEDLSSGGVMLILDKPDRPPVGTTVQVRVCGLLSGESPPMVEATVVRHTDEGVAIRFAEDVRS